MNFKHVLISFLALMLLPVAATAQFNGPYTPALGTAMIVVTKTFEDGNTESDATFYVSCTSGTVTPVVKTLSADANGEELSFVVSNIPVNGPENECTVTEAPIDGYYGETACYNGTNLTSETVHCGSGPLNGTNDTRDDFCYFADVDIVGSDAGRTSDGVYGCDYHNFAEAVDVDVHKVWEMVGSTQADVDQDVRITLVCDGEIVGGSEVSSGKWKESMRLKLDKGDYDDEDGDYTGMGTASFEVIPDFYSTAADPDDQVYTTCFAKENVQDSYVEIDNGCGDSFKTGTIMVAVGMGDECTITNTVFFEGIPTLNQYGMAIMALLMLGVGFVGFRRFV